MNIWKTAGLLGALALGTHLPAADIVDTLHVNIPFAFVAGTQQLPAGKYVVKEADSGLILLQSGDKAAMVLSVPAGFAKAGTTSSLRFQENAQQLHLVSVDAGGEVSRSIPMQPTEPQRTVSFTAKR